MGLSVSVAMVTSVARKPIKINFGLIMKRCEVCLLCRILITKDTLQGKKAQRRNHCRKIKFAEWAASLLLIFKRCGKWDSLSSCDLQLQAAVLQCLVLSVNSASVTS